MMLFPAVLINFPNSKVCLIGEWSIAFNKLPFPFNRRILPILNLFDLRQRCMQNILKQVLITYKTRAHAQLSVTLLPQAVSQTFRHI